MYFILKDMAYRFTDTNKWNDKWFLDLKPVEKLLFNYLCDNCDCAGFIEINIRKWSNEIGNNNKDIEGALKGLTRGLIYSTDSEYIYVRTFLKHQKHYPLNPKDNIYKGIILRFEYYLYKFNIQDINLFIEGALKPLSRDNGNGNGIGIGNGIGNDNILNKGVEILKTWRTDFETYKNELREIRNSLVNDIKFIELQEKYNPGIDIVLTIDKSCLNYWATEAGWKNKKSKQTKDIDWKATLTNAISQPTNKVYKDRNDKIPYGI